MALKRQKAISETPVLAGRRDSCLRSVPDSSKYIDLPEHPELRSGHLNRADRELSRKNPFTLQFAIRHPVFVGIYRKLISALECRQRSCLLEYGFLVHSLPCRSAPQNSGNPLAPDHSPWLEMSPAKASNRSVFYVVWKKFFGLLRFLESLYSNV